MRFLKNFWSYPKKSCVVVPRILGCLVEGGITLGALVDGTGEVVVVVTVVVDGDEGADELTDEDEKTGTLEAEDGLTGLDLTAGVVELELLNVCLVVGCLEFIHCGNRTTQLTGPS